MANTTVQPQPTPDWSDSLAPEGRKGLNVGKNIVTPPSNIPEPRETAVGDPLAIQETYLAVDVSCAVCGWDGQFSTPKKYSGPETWECPKCGTRFKVVIKDE